MTSHAHHVEHGAHAGMTAMAAVMVAALAMYVWAVWRLRSSGRSWNRLRSASFAVGILMVLVALSPEVARAAHLDLRIHMLQHLLLGMLGPIGIVFGAPMTLALRALPARHARRWVSVLRWRPTAWLSHPLTALVLNLGGMSLLYASPIYGAMATSSVLHMVVHLHFLLAGCLFSWAIAGPDPSPHRPPHLVRLAVLFMAMAGHATLSKVMYAYHWPAGTQHDVAQIEAAAKVMYYGGDLSELLLAIALFASWPAARSHAGSATQRSSPRTLEEPLWHPRS